MTPYHFFLPFDSNTAERASHTYKYVSKDQCKKSGKGFTLIETLVAVALLTIAIVAPMSLTTQSLASSYYARDQITAFHLAQEAIESVRHARDHNVLEVALGNTGVNLLNGIPINQYFTVDTTTIDPVTQSDLMTPCPQDGCPKLKKNSDGLYSYQSGSDSQFTRTVNATYVPNTASNEVKVVVTVSWQTGSYRTKSFTISDNLYRWVKDDSAAR